MNNKNHPSWSLLQKDLQNSLKNIPLSTALKYKRTINKLTHWGKTIPDSDILVLQQICNQLNHLDRLLQPLENFGIYYSLMLAGGSVRDILLGHADKIKDLDIIISFDNTLGELIYNRKIVKKEVEKFIQFLLPTDELKNQFSKTPYTQNTSPLEHWFKPYTSKKRKFSKEERQLNDIINNSISYELLEIIFHKENLITSGFHPHEKSLNNIENDPFNSGAYTNNRLAGVLKLNHKNWAWPVDILVTKFSCNKYLEGFDFNICKAGFEIVNSHDRKCQKFLPPLSPESLLKNTIFDKTFLQDIIDKKITLDADKFSLNEISRACETHYYQLKNKYKPSEWELSFELTEPTPHALNSDYTQEWNDKKSYISYFLNSFKIKESKNNTNTNNSTNLISNKDTKHKHKI